MVGNNQSCPSSWVARRLLRHAETYRAVHTRCLTSHLPLCQRPSHFHLYPELQFLSQRKSRRCPMRLRSHSCVSHRTEECVIRALSLQVCQQTPLFHNLLLQITWHRLSTASMEYIAVGLRRLHVTMSRSRI